MGNGQKRPSACYLAFIAVACSLMLPAYANARALTHTFETEVREVRASSVNGQNRLLLEIDAVTGPVGCMSSSVILSAEGSNAALQDNLEAVALQAFISSESVVVSVPTAFDSCIDGKPVVTALRLLAT